MPAVPASLTYVTDADPGYTRHKAGKGFTYRDETGTTITDKPTLQRMKSLGIPPAYTQVWISADPAGHIQATGRDARGRKQYRYHPDWNEARDLGKYGRMLEFAQLLPKIRRHIRKHMAQEGLGREKVLATIVNLLETTLIRIGNEDYARTNKSYGLTTLRDHHARIRGQELRFSFTGKSGKDWNLRLTDRRIAKIVKACQDLPGQKLFQYLDENGERHAITSQDVNAYLREISGHEITAKDFRTWAGTVMAADQLRQAELATSATAAKRIMTTAVKEVASRLGNTPAICRRCYIHPEVFVSYQKGRLHEDIADRVAERKQALIGLRVEEIAVVIFLDTRQSPSRTSHKTSSSSFARAA